MSTIEKIDVGYLENPAEVFIVSAATDAKLVLFQSRTTRYSVKEQEGKLQYVLLIPKAFSDDVRAINFPFGAIALQLIVNAQVIELATPELLSRMEFAQPVPLQRGMDILLSYQLNPAKFAGGRNSLGLSVAHLGIPIFELGMRRGDLSKPEDLDLAKVVDLLEDHHCF